jgi:hypothetical protein
VTTKFKELKMQIPNVEMNLEEERNPLEKFRGEFEDRLKAVSREIKVKDGEIVFRG